MPVLLFLLMLSLSAFASEAATDSSAVLTPSESTAAVVAVDALMNDEAKSESPATRNIPLPRQTAYTGKGLSIGVAGGIFNPTEECDCMGIWQAQMEFFYTDWISGGIDVRYFGGDLDDEVMIMYQRYRLNVRLHKAWEKLDLFIEPVFGLENSSISEFRHQVENHTSSSPNHHVHTPSSWNNNLVWSNDDFEEEEDLDSLRVEISDCEKMFSLDGFSVGIGAGMGYRLSRFWGVTGNVLYEYNFSRAMQLSLIPGIAFNMREIGHWAKKSLLSAWISLEIGTQRYFNRGVNEWASYGILGFQLAI